MSMHPRRVTAALVALVAFAILLVIRADPQADFDTARDLLQAQACANGNVDLCGTSPPTWMGGFAHGSLWIRFLALCHWLGLSFGAAKIVTSAFIAAGAGITASTTYRHTGPLPAWLAGAGFAQLALSTTQQHIFWNPTLLPLPLAVFTWALLAHAHGGRARTAVLAAFSLALSIDLHLVCVALAPLLMVTIVASARSQFRTMALVVATMGSTLIIDSPGTWAHNLRAVDLSIASWSLLLLAVSLSMVHEVARPYWARASHGLRSAALVALMSAWCVVPMLTGNAVERYFTPALPALPIAGALLLHAIVARRSLALKWALAGLVVLGMSRALPPATPPHETWSLSQLARLLPIAKEHGIEGKAVFSRVEGLSFNTLASLAALAPSGPGRPGDDLVVARASRDHLPESPPEEWTVIELTDDEVAVLRPSRPYLQRHRLKACFQPLGAGPDTDCAEASLDISADSFEYPPFSSAWSVFNQDQTASALDGYRVDLWLDIDTGEDGPSHIVDLMEPDGGFEIVAVEGVGYEGELPGRRVILEGGSGRGRLSLSHVRPAGASPPSHFSMMLIETLPEEVELRRLLAERAHTPATTAQTGASASSSQGDRRASSD